jgi:hypothetical protein
MFRIVYILKKNLKKYLEHFKNSLIYIYKLIMINVEDISIIV